MTPTLVAAIGLPLLLVVALVLGAAFWIRSLRLSAMGELLELLEGMPRVLSESANCFGVSSLGMAQVRGNGCLALSDKQLLFVQWVPRRVVTVPVGAITEVATVRSHLGKSRGGKLLQVHWSHDGVDDSVGFQVSDLPRWVGELALVQEAHRSADARRVPDPARPQRGTEPERA